MTDTVAGHKEGLRRRSVQETVRRQTREAQDAYLAAIQACLRSGRNPISDLDMPFRPEWVTGIDG